MKSLNVKLTGRSPLLMHNGQGANPDDPRPLPDFLKKEWAGMKSFSEALKSMKNKRGKTEKDNQKLAKLGCLLYTSPSPRD